MPRFDGENEKGPNQPTIYRYVSGAWIWLPATVSGDLICANGDGYDSYFLGGTPSG